MLKRVVYHLGPYTGSVVITVDDDADDDTIIAKARAQVLKQWGPILMGAYYSEWRIEEP